VRKEFVCIAALIALPSAAVAAPDASRGRRLFIQCQACHSLAPGAPHKIGPNLYGTVNAPAGVQRGYNYSPALKKSGLRWDEATLHRWLAKPAAVVPGNKMVYSGLRNAADRQQIIDYMKRSSR
jgi:cytochrome c